MSYFSTLLPPPNLTGILHLGHMWNAILQDTLMRYYIGFLGKENCNWGFGLDHAGISLQIKVEEQLKKENTDKSKLGKEEFNKRLWQWKEKYESRIMGQYSQLGYLLNLEEKRFTLDDRSVEYSVSVFKQLYSDGLIYRAEKLVYWDTFLNTAISDSEVEYVETKTKMYHIKYYYSSEEYLTVSTTRPETILGDVAIFVNPKDERYFHLIGKKVKVPIVNREVFILSDDHVDPLFETGVMKCTPAHDFDDERLAKKHNLPMIKIFGSDLKVLVDPYQGQDKNKVKDQIISLLKERNLITEKDYVSKLSYSSRSGFIVEPILSLQWFIKSSILSEKALDYWNKHCFDMKVTKPSKDQELRKMLSNMEDWCISRQLEWGIKIPVYICGDKHSLEEKDGFLMSDDVLDTWFSSSLWPSIVFKDKNKFLPLTVLISGKDILLFWISKMAFMHFYLHGCFPFKNIFLHGLVLDSQNRKMSKSLNNGVDPLELIKEFSHDSVRLFFLSNTHQDSNIVFSKTKINYYEKFLHKLKNAAIFVASQNERKSQKKLLNLNEMQILHFFRNLKIELKQCYSSFSFDVIATKIVDFVRDKFCNQYLEIYKILRPYGKNNQGFLIYIWNSILAILSPIIPDFTSQFSIEKEEDVWGEFEFKNINWFVEYLNVFENIRKRLSIKREQPIDVRIYGEGLKNRTEISEYLGYIKHTVKSIESTEKYISNSNHLLFSVYTSEVNFLVWMDLEESYVREYKKILLEKKKWLIKEIDFLNGRLKQFNDKTPSALVKEVNEKLDKYNKDLYYTSKIINLNLF